MAKGTRTRNVAANDLSVNQEQAVNTTSVSDTVVGLAEKHTETKDITTEEVMEILKQKGINEAEITIDDKTVLMPKKLEQANDMLKDVIMPDDQQKEAMPIPTPGRFVTFFPHTSDQLHSSGKSWPALVTEADKDGNLSLQVFGKYTIGPRFTIPHKDYKQKGSELGHWEWPARS